MLPPLVFPTFKADIAAARLRLGHGVCMPFQVAGSSGELKMEPGPAPVGVQPLCFETACGVLAFSEPGPQFSLIGECPMTLAQAGNDPNGWFWALFNHHMSPQVQALFGHLRLVPGTRPLNFGCRLCVTLGASRATGYLWLSAESFLALCKAGPWRSVAGSVPAQFQLAVEVTLSSNGSLSDSACAKPLTRANIAHHAACFISLRPCIRSGMFSIWLSAGLAKNRSRLISAFHLRND